jgi:hypothetical protein
LALFVQALYPAVVTESASELATSADVDGDQLLDLLLANKLTGEIRVGYQNTNGAFDWSAPRSSGLSQVAGLATGRFFTGGEIAVAVSSASENLVHLLDLADPDAPLRPAPAATAGVGPGSLAGLWQATASVDKLVAATEGNGASQNNQLEVITFDQGASSVAASLGTSNRIERLQAFRLAGLDEPLVAAMARGTTDAFKVFRVAPTISLMAQVTNLHAGSDFVFANFGGGQRVVFYTPGVMSGLVESSLTAEGEQVVIGPGVAIGNIGQPIRSLSVVSNTGIDQLIVIFEGGQTARIYDRAKGGIAETQTVNANAGEYFSAAVGVNSGELLLFSTDTAFRATSTRFRQLRASGRRYTDIAQGLIPGGSADLNRANLWLFEREPFVALQPRFLASLNGADWTESASGLPGALTVLGSTDAGPTNGLRDPASINLGAPPAAAGAALVNQYHPTISFFSFSLPRPSGASEILIMPPPGRYPSEIVVSFSPANAGDTVFYRLTETNAWQPYAAPFVLSNTAQVRFYGQTLDGSRRSPLQLASYTLPGSLSLPEAATNNFSTNGLPGSQTNTSPALIVSGDGTLIYGRRGTGGPTVWAIGLNGTGDRQITVGARPRLSPDGRYIAFLRGADPFMGQGNVWLRDFASSQEKLLFEHSDTVIGLDWDPANATLFIDYSCLIWRLGIDGAPASEIDLPFDCYDDAPATHPQGARIAFHNLNSDPNVRGLYVGNLETRSRQKLPVPILSARWPSWSPDGQWLAVAGDGGTEPPLNQVANLFVVSADGTTSYQITAFGKAGDGFQNGAIWGADGGSLIGAASLNGRNGIYVVPLVPDLSACAAPPSRLETSPGDPIDFVGSLAAPPASPELFITSVASEVFVSWRTSVADFNLEASLTVGPTAQWQVISGPFASSGGFFRHLVPPADRQTSKFYRLRRGSVAASATRPNLYISSGTSGMIVTWRTSLADFNLEASPALGRNAAWQPISGPFPSRSGFFEYVVPPVDRQAIRFYRLSRP